MNPVGHQHPIPAGASLPFPRNTLLDEAAAQVGIDKPLFRPLYRLGKVSSKLKWCVGAQVAEQTAVPLMQAGVDVAKTHGVKALKTALEYAEIGGEKVLRAAAPFAERLLQ